MITCTIGVMAYNEEQNIEQVLRALLCQRIATCRVAEIVVVASGCTDRTVELAEALACVYPVIRVEVQAERAGKAAAINRLLKLASGDVIVQVGADTLPHPDAVEHLVAPFADPGVGMTGAQVVPLNDPSTFLGFAVQMLWRLHHRLALRSPKLGELVAYRNVVEALPEDSATDEVALEALITRQGYRLLYIPKAIVYNRGPETHDDFVHQRRRIFTGHLQIAANDGYFASSMSPVRLLPLVAEGMWHYRNLLPWVAGAALLEAWARLLGVLDYTLGANHRIWRPIRSSKQVCREQRPLTVVALSCRGERVALSSLIRRARRAPLGDGALLWWDRLHSQLLLSFASDDWTALALEERLKGLAAQMALELESNPSGGLAYQLIRFTPQLVPEPNTVAYEYQLRERAVNL